MLIRHGYGVLLLDPRGQGRSEGDTVRWAGDRDLNAAVAYLHTRPDVDPNRIGGFGFSVGGELLIEAAAQPHNGFSAIISDGAGSRVGDEDISGPQRLLAEPNLAVMTAAVSLFSNHGPPPPIEAASGISHLDPCCSSTQKTASAGRPPDSPSTTPQRASPNPSGVSAAPTTRAASTHDRSNMSAT